MPLPAGFQFTQSSLQDYVECARRFELRYLQRLKWPAVDSEPVIEREQHMRLGQDFHHLVHQHVIGLPEAALSAIAVEEPLRTWWAAYLRHGLKDLPPERYPEIALSTPIGAYRLLAKADLIAVEPGARAVIVDWKTGERKPRRDRLAARMQTVVYRYVLAVAAHYLNQSAPFRPDQIEMVYWFTSDPADPERLAYDETQFEADAALLKALIAEIEARDEFELTPDVRRCAFCPYRSLCRRGIEAGRLDAVEDDADELPGLDELVLDFDHIAEIEF